MRMGHKDHNRRAVWLVQNLGIKKFRSPVDSRVVVVKTTSPPFTVQLEECERRQRELQSIRLALEKEISVKKTSISIDRDRCLR